MDNPGRAEIKLHEADYGGNGEQYILLEAIVGQTSGARAIIQDVTGDNTLIISLIGDTEFVSNEMVVGGTSGAQWVVDTFTFSKGYI